MISNEEEQRDELDILQSIFDSEFTLLRKDCTQYELKVLVELPKYGINLQTHVNPVMGGEEEIPDTVDFILHYVPPLVLTITYPPTYPSESPPQYTIQSSWLNHTQLAILCQRLDEVWEEMKYSVVVYVWTLELKNCIELLGIYEDNNNIELYNYFMHGVIDTRGVIADDNPQNNLLKLLEYNREEVDKVFKNGEHECLLCMDTYNGRDFIKLGCCGKFYCNYCIIEMTKLNIKEGTVQLIKCPNCNQPIHPSVIKPITNDEEFQRWEYLTLKRAVEGMEDTEYCPKCETLVICDDSIGQCTNCEYVFCAKCLDSYPCSVSGNDDCIMARESILLRKSRTKESEEEIKTLNFMKREGINKRCPVCKMFIEKSSGCNKMHCTNCGKFFCYICGFAIGGYDHFGSNACPLFSNPNANSAAQPQQIVRRPIEVINVEGGEQFMFPVKLERKSCPTCGQVNWKQTKNNDVNCWACNKHFCFLCGVSIKGTKHFSPVGCLQHTDF